MILLVCGTQAPFDRLVQIVDDWAKNISVEVYAQTGVTSYKGKNIDCVDFFPPEEFYRRFDEAECIVSHAGMGTIISALEKNKPIIVFPRRREYGEHRDNHQIDTADSFKKLDYVYVAMDKTELLELLDSYKNLRVKKEIGPFAEKRLLNKIKNFISEI